MYKELLPCPFCGDEATIYGNSKIIGTKLKHYQVAVCTNDDCGCRTSPCETVEDAIYRWNKRGITGEFVPLTGYYYKGQQLYVKKGATNGEINKER